jgi:hypothetical protein
MLNIILICEQLSTVKHSSFSQPRQLCRKVSNLGVPEWSTFLYPNSQILDWPHDIQHNGILHNDTQNIELTCDTQHK